MLSRVHDLLVHSTLLVLLDQLIQVAGCFRCQEGTVGHLLVLLLLPKVIILEFELLDLGELLGFASGAVAVFLLLVEAVEVGLEVVNGRLDLRLLLLVLLLGLVFVKFHIILADVQVGVLGHLEHPSRGLIFLGLLVQGTLELACGLDERL